MIKKRFDMQYIQDAHWSKSKHKRRNPDHPVVRSAFEPLAEIVASSINNPVDSTVLDVGCGNGYLQWSLEGAFKSVAGIDFYRQMLEVNPCSEKYLGSCTNLPFADKSFDLVVASHLLHHLSEPRRFQTLLEMKRVARSAVVSFEPNRNNPFMYAFSLITWQERMALRFSSFYMRKLFTRVGFLGVDTHVEGWIVPNKAPVWWIPVGQALAATSLRAFGVDICTVGHLTP
jgi:SAM-dependent methyltransferase